MTAYRYYMTRVQGGDLMRDPTVKFALKVKDLLALQALADQRNQSLAKLLRSLVHEATQQGRKAGNTDDEQQDASSTPSR
jgi:hypothetical protein